jgi:hypothetical protein
MPNKPIKDGKNTTEFLAMLGGIALGAAMTVVGATVPGTQALLSAGPGLITLSITGYQVSRGLAKQ